MNRRRRGTSQDASFVCPCRFCSKHKLAWEATKIYSRVTDVTQTHIHIHTPHSTSELTFSRNFFVDFRGFDKNAARVLVPIAHAALAASRSSCAVRDFLRPTAPDARVASRDGPEVRARRHVPPDRTHARPRAGAPRPSLTAVAPPVRAGTGAAGAVDARRCASMVHQMASATMAVPEPSTRCAASAPTALTAALGRQLIFRLLWPRPTRHHRACRPLTP